MSVPENTSAFDFPGRRGGKADKGEGTLRNRQNAPTAKNVYIQNLGIIRTTTRFPLGKAISSPPEAAQQANSAEGHAPPPSRPSARPRPTATGADNDPAARSNKRRDGQFFSGGKLQEKFYIHRASSEMHLRNSRVKTYGREDRLSQ